jgi:hypothetical protein
MSLRRDEYGFLRSNSYGQASGTDLRTALGAVPGDQVYRSSAAGGFRRSAPVDGDDVSFHPGDTFAVGPKVTKASPPAQLQQEWRALQRGGYGQIAPPEETDWGFAIKLFAFALPGGVRTNALILLPKDYPVTPPIGFYIHEKGLAAVTTLGIDVRHLFPNQTFYGAPNFANHGWAWFCLKFQPWRPGHHSLLGIVMMVAAVIAEGAKA